MFIRPADDQCPVVYPVIKKTVLVGIAIKLQWNLDIMKGQQTGKIVPFRIKNYR